MLRASSVAFGYDLDIAAIGDPSIPVGVPGGNTLLEFVNAVLGNGDADAAREAVQAELGPAGLVDAASVLGNFQMMNRVAEGTGIPVPQQAIDRDTEVVDALGLRDFLDK